jgi:hypothetical protein
MQTKPTRYFYDKHVREIDADLSLAIINPTIYNPNKIDINPIRNRQFTKGQTSPFGQRVVSYSHSKNRFRKAYYPVRQVRQAREKERLKDKIKPILYRINCLCKKDKLTMEEGLELDALRVRLSPSYKEKLTQADIQCKKEFNEKLKNSEIAQCAHSLKAGAKTLSQ